MMALSLPSTAGALGLGEIHVDSALNEPLAAEIDIVGASAEDLIGLTAAVANKETFAHLNADRPAFLQSTTFKVAKNSRGRPVLAIRSTESFSEPLVDLVVDLRWYNGELIRQYSLLLDPVGFPAATRLATAVGIPMVPPPSTLAATLPMPRVAVTGVPMSTDSTDSATSTGSTTSAATTSVVSTPRKLTQVKVGAKATLRGVAWRVGARSEVDLQTLMYAIFRANPGAFDGNINRLHRGALLNIPSADEVASLSKSEASREIHAQMAAWRGGTKGSRTTSATPGATLTAPSAVASTVAPSVASPATPPVAAAAPLSASATAALDQRMQSLEKNLRDMQVSFDREHDRMLGLQAQLTYAENHKPALSVVQAAPVGTQRSFADLIAAGLVSIGAFGAFFYWQRRRQAPPPTPIAAALEPVTAPISAAAAAPAPAAPATMEADAPMAMPAAIQAAPPSARVDVPPERHADRTDVVPSLASRILDDIDIASLESSYMEEALEHTQPASTSADTAVLEGAAEDTATAVLNRADLDEDVNLEHSLVDDTVNLNVDSATLPAATMIVPMMPMAQLATPVATVHVDTTKLDYNLVDLDLSTQHVNMPSGLNEPAVVKERRTNLVDVLKMAIDREPDRRDLRMKLLETYYAAAAANRQGFLDAVQKFARERDYLVNGEWDKISYMGRQIAGDTPLFAEDTPEKGDLADCA